MTSQLIYPAIFWHVSKALSLKTRAIKILSKLFFFFYFGLSMGGVQCGLGGGGGSSDADVRTFSCKNIFSLNLWYVRPHGERAIFRVFVRTSFTDPNSILSTYAKLNPILP